MKQLNVLMVEPYPFAKTCGNIKAQSFVLYKTDKRKFKVRMLVPFVSEFTDNLTKQGIEIIVVPPHQRLLQYGGKWAKDHLWGRLLTMLSIIPYNLNLLSLIKKKNIDVIHCNCIRSLLYIVLAAKLSSTPVLWYVKSELVHNILDRIGFVLADKILFLCETNKRDKYPKLVNFFGKKIELLRMGLDIQDFMNAEKNDKTSLKQELSINEKMVNVVIVGRLCAIKGVHYLLEALGMIITRHPNVMLYIVGDHVIDEHRSYKDELLRIIKENNLEPHVRFTGWRNDALEIISLMDILVMPSSSEGFGRSVLEAMALGKPVVASRLGGLRELIKDGENGFLVEPGDVRSLAEKISLLIKNKELRDSFGKAGKEIVLSEYLIQDHISKLERIWTDMGVNQISAER